MTARVPPRAVDLSRCPSPHSRRSRLGRLAWSLVWLALARPSPTPLFAWRRLLLRAFGAKVGRGVKVYPSARVWAPWNLEMGDHSTLGERVDCYSVDKVCIGAHALVSQYSFLCAATHDYRQPRLPLVTAPIVVGEGAWLAADVFVGPGVTIGEGAVVGARSSVYKDVEPWTLVGGNPARYLKRREVGGP
jgi:putative colanic acid biosynthesis acetyltransferase WcaF